MTANLTAETALLMVITLTFRQRILMLPLKPLLKGLLIWLLPHKQFLANIVDINDVFSDNNKELYL